MKQGIMVGLWLCVGALGPVWGSDASWILPPEWAFATEHVVEEDAPVSALDEMQRALVREYFEQFGLDAMLVASFVNLVEGQLQVEGGDLNVVCACVLLRYFDIEGIERAERAVRLSIENGMDQVAAFFTVFFEWLGFGESLAQRHGRTLRLRMASSERVSLMQMVFEHAYRVFGLSDDEARAAYLAQEAGLQPGGRYKRRWIAFVHQFLVACSLEQIPALMATLNANVYLRQGMSMSNALLRVFLNVYGRRGDDVYASALASYERLLGAGLCPRAAQLRVLREYRR